MRRSLPLAIISATQFMKRANVMVVGGGVVGLVTAYFLNKKGYNVQILEKRDGAALGASFANGSQISFSHIVPLSFDERQSLIQRIFNKKRGILVNKKNTEVRNFLLKRKEEALNFDSNLESLIEFSRLSSESLDEICKTEDASRYIKSCGIAHVFRDESVLQKYANFARKFDQKFKIFSKNQTRFIDRNIKSISEKMVGGIFFRNDKTSNCYDLCKFFEGLLRERGVEFIFDANIVGFKTKNKNLVSVILEDGRSFGADIFVLANGSGIIEASSSLDLKLDVFKVRGYSYTFNIRNSGYIPNIGIIDNHNKMVYSSYKEYLRVGGFFDLGIESEPEIDDRMRIFKETIFSSFPALKRNGIVHKWTENRVFSPNSLPIIKKIDKFSNLFVNAGHGPLGLTLSFGSGKMLADMV